MDEQKEGADKKPFYENIVSKRKRTEGRRSTSGGDRARSSGGDRARSNSSDRARPNTGDRARTGERPGSSERFGTSGRPVPGAGDSATSSRGQTHAPRGAGRDAHDSRQGRDARDSRGTRDNRDSRDGRTPRAPSDARARSGAPRAASGHDGARSPRSSSASPREGSRAPRKPFAGPEELTPVFKAILPETRALLEAFPEIAQAVLPLDSKRLQELPAEIRELSHSLTDERGERRVGYMNEPAVISAYVRYYMWWNLVRLTRIFSGLPLSLKDGDSAVDLGSGPLTVPIALWMARPELRSLKLTWYCVDLSQGALSAGEELFLSLAARTGNEPWQIVRIKGECGAPLRRRVALVSSANMFNELFWDNPAPLEQQVKHHAKELESYADRASSILIVEPGVPRAGRFISLMRDAFIRDGFSVKSPCPHEGACPFPGLRTGKWCHFVFDTADAPAKLHKISEDAGLAKDRAALSFVFASRTEEAKPGEAEEAAVSVDATVEGTAEGSSSAAPAPAIPSEAPLSMVSRMSSFFPDLSVRITSDPIRLPEYHTGRYGCSELGMVMLMGTYQAADYLVGCHSGSLVKVPMPDRKRPERDAKTGAIIIRLK